MLLARADGGQRRLALVPRPRAADGAHERYLPVDVSQGEPSPETLTKVVPRVVRKMQVDKDGTMTFFGTAGDGR